MNLTRSTLGNLRWTYGAAAVSSALQVAYTAVMGRLLEPADFGLVAMALVFLRFGTYFAEMGIGPALIQREDLSEREVRAGFTSSVLLGLGFSAVTALVAPVAELLFTTPGVTDIVRALSLTFALNGIGIAALNLLRRRLRFRALALIEVVSYCVGYLGLGVVFALRGAGPYSLVAAALGQATLQSLLAYIVERHPVRPLLAGIELRTLYGFGGRVSVINFLEFLGATLDTLAIGRFAGATPLGQYNRASLLVTLPFQRLVLGFSDVMFPTLSRIQTERERVSGAYLSAVRVTAALLLPLAAGLGIAAPETVRVLLGDGWEGTARVLPLLALAGALDMLSHIGGIVCEALAVLNRKLALQAGYLVMLGLLLLAAAGRDLIAYAVALLVAQVLRLGLYGLLTGRVLGIEARAQAAALGTGVLGGAVVATAIWGVSTALRGMGAPAGPLFAVQILTGAAALAGLLLVGPLSGVRREVARRLGDAGYLPALVALLAR